MGVNNTKLLKSVEEQGKKALDEAKAAAEAAGPEPEKTDCDTIKKKNAAKFMQVFQNFITENKGNIPAVLKTIDPQIQEIQGTLVDKKIIEQRWFSNTMKLGNFEKKIIEYATEGGKYVVYFTEDIDKIFLEDGAPPAAAEPAAAEPAAAPAAAPTAGGVRKSGTDAAYDEPKPKEGAEGAEDKPAEEKPAEEKPAEGAEEKPAEDKPADAAGEAPKEEEYTSKYGVIITKVMKKEKLTPTESNELLKKIIEQYIYAIRYYACQEVLVYIVDSKPFKFLYKQTEIAPLKAEIKSGDKTKDSALEESAAKDEPAPAAEGTPAAVGGGEGGDEEQDGGKPNFMKNTAEKESTKFKKEKKAELDVKKKAFMADIPAIIKFMDENKDDLLAVWARTITYGKPNITGKLVDSNYLVPGVDPKPTPIVDVVLKAVLAYKKEPETTGYALNVLKCTPAGDEGAEPAGEEGAAPAADDKGSAAPAADDKGAAADDKGAEKPAQGGGGKGRKKKRVLTKKPQYVRIGKKTYVLESDTSDSDSSSCSSSCSSSSSSSDSSSSSSSSSDSSSSCSSSDSSDDEGRIQKYVVNKTKRSKSKKSKRSKTKQTKI
jgi:hypothetical protein